MITSQDIDIEHDNPKIKRARQALKAELARIEETLTAAKAAAEQVQDVRALIAARKEAEQRTSDAFEIYNRDLQDIAIEEDRLLQDYKIALERQRQGK